MNQLIVKPFPLQPFSDLVENVKKSYDCDDAGILVRCKGTDFLERLRNLKTELTKENVEALLKIIEERHVFEGNDPCVAIENIEFIFAMAHLVKFVEEEFVPFKEIKHTDKPYPREIILLNGKLRVVDSHYDGKFHVIDLPYDEDNYETCRIGRDYSYVFGYMCV